MKYITNFYYRAKYVLRERELLLRTDGKIHYFHLKTSYQICFILIILSMVSWGGAMSVNYILQLNEVAVREEMILDSRVAYQDLIKQMKLHKNNLNEQLSNDLSSTDPQEMETLAALEKTLDAFVGRLSIDLDNNEALSNQIIKTRNALFSEVSGLNNQLLDEKEAREKLLKSMDVLSEVIGDSEPDQNLEEEAITDNTETRIASNSASKVEDQISRLMQIYQYQSGFTDQFELYLQDALDQRESILKITKVSLPKLLELVGVPQSVGGPEISEDKAMPQVSGQALALLEKQQAIQTQIDRLRSLDSLLACLPLAAPVDYYYVSSGFGKRQDPLSKKKAVHYGLDLAGKVGINIYASAGGVVTKAGRHAAYGNLVEIDHGCNVITRYAHLKAIHVKRGQMINFRDVVGTLGSTGRSTGPHVHFEVVINGLNVDPQPFIEAGRYVYKTTKQFIADSNNPIPPTYNPASGKS